ncbi:Glyoxylase, beta-lactamase superfamily II [Chitinophaga sp. CF118]|uniref:MBL fold metallo-hydrolase n=1 Tax=Chitinophaga sp. CF118 TaxID=1884367 RepID=UPI0008E605F7|nr:MBL fold metallo-hydrolase [Chitinophaga sp. CF118]SFD02549.1 Glyoxylase, beta-lactamase superfamily II [Chitinophaga sp. CF118]
MKNKQTHVIIRQRIRKEWFYVAPGVWGIRDKVVNVYLVHDPSSNHWVLVDTGLFSTAAKIKRVAEQLFWPQVAPSAIVLTHGHFDHVGSARKLSDEWDIPVYAHYLEAPYLTGRSAYPPPDSSVGGGLFSWLSFLYPRQALDLEGRLLLLPENGKIPGLNEWKYIHTPGHAPGHISLYRERDGVLLAGDAFVTTRQESLISVITQEKIISGPPKYFTYDWLAAERSVKTLAGLRPSMVASGHGRPMGGNDLEALHSLAENFKEQAVPSSGRYVDDPAVTGISGVEYLPVVDNRKLVLKVAATLAVIGVGIFLLNRVKKSLE